MPSEQFEKRVANIYSGMRRRTSEKKWKSGRNAGRVRRQAIPLPFNQKQLGEWVLKIFGGEFGVICCEYCTKPIDLLGCAVDHCVPLHRGGSAGLDNLGVPCAECNNIKGRMTREEFRFFNGLMMTFAAKFGNTPVTDVMGRLEKCTKLAAGAWNSRQKQAKETVKAVIPEEDFLADFC